MAAFFPGLHPGLLSFNPLRGFSWLTFKRRSAKPVNSHAAGGALNFLNSEALNPKEPTAYNTRGIAKFNLGDYHGAIADYTKSIEINPRHAKAHYNRGVAKHHLGDHQGAISDFTTAIEINPMDADAYLTRGIAKIKLGQKDSGCKDFSKAGELGHETAYDVIKELCR